MSIRNMLVLSVFVVVGGSIAACNNSSRKAESGSSATKAASTGHAHDGWWCDEHGVPEGVCALCDTKLVADFKARNDWCDKHNRPDSHCFVCHPEKEAEFAALYEAKYGKKPPKPETGGDEHEKEALKTT